MVERSVIIEASLMDKKLTFHKKILFLFSGFVLIITLLASPALIFAQDEVPDPDPEPNFSTYTLEDFGLSADDTLQGVLVSRDYGITLPATWNHVTDAVVNIDFSHSKALNPKSSMTIDWNNVRLASIQLTNENADDGQFNVSIPVDSIKQGYNTLHVEFYMGISDYFCDDYDNPAVWAAVKKSTSFRFSTDLTQIQPDLGNLPSPFFDESPLSKNHVTLVMSENPDLGK
jgi:hypothetical protein